MKYHYYFLIGYLLNSSCFSSSATSSISSASKSIDESFYRKRNAYTYKLNDILTINQAIDFCNDQIYCAGVSKLTLNITKGTNPKLARKTKTYYYGHSFLPLLLKEVVYSSSNKYTIHTASVVQTNNIFHYQQDIPLSEAKLFCYRNTKCVAFFYAAQNSNLKYIKKAYFVHSISNLKESPNGLWRTYIINDNNDQTKRKRINIDTIEYFTTINNVYDEMQPYKMCCRTNVLPTVEQLMDVDTFQRISCKIPREEFRKNYEETRTPVMLVGCHEQWPAKKRWNSKKMWKRFDNTTMWRNTWKDGQDLTSFQEMKELNANRDSFFYVFDNLHHEIGRTVEADYETPAPFANGDLFSNLDKFPGDTYGPMRWFAWGNSYTGTLPHSDPFATDAWNTVVSGYKWWILYPKSVQDAEAVECEAQCSIHTNNNLQLWFASVAANAMITEYSNKKRPRIILQKPGETIYVPNGFVHAVINFNETIAITANYGSEGNLFQVWREMLKSVNYEHAYQAYYKVFNKVQRKFVRESGYWPIEKGRKRRYTEPMPEEDDGY